MSRTVEGCEEIMRKLVKSGVTNQISKKNLEMMITLVRGGDPRTLKNWTRNLTTLEYLTQLNASVFKINLMRVNGLLEQAIKEGGQKKLL